MSRAPSPITQLLPAPAAQTAGYDAITDFAKAGFQLQQVAKETKRKTDYNNFLAQMTEWDAEARVASNQAGTDQIQSTYANTMRSRYEGYLNKNQEILQDARLSRMVTEAYTTASAEGNANRTAVYAKKLGVDQHSSLMKMQAAYITQITESDDPMGAHDLDGMGIKLKRALYGAIGVSNGYVNNEADAERLYLDFMTNAKAAASGVIVAGANNSIREIIDNAADAAAEGAPIDIDAQLLKASGIYQSLTERGIPGFSSEEVEPVFDIFRKNLLKSYNDALDPIESAERFLADDKKKKPEYMIQAGRAFREELKAETLQRLNPSERDLSQANAYQKALVTVSDFANGEGELWKDLDTETLSGQRKAAEGAHAYLKRQYTAGFLTANDYKNARTNILAHEMEKTHLKYKNLMDDFEDVDKETEVNLDDLLNELNNDWARWKKFLEGRDIDTSKLESGIRDIDRTLTRLESLLSFKGEVTGAVRDFFRGR